MCLQVVHSSLTWSVYVSAGPSGASVRELGRLTGADIKSWTEKAAAAPGKPRLQRPVRSFVIEVSHIIYLS